MKRSGSRLKNDGTHTRISAVCGNYCNNLTNANKLLSTACSVYTTTRPVVAKGVAMRIVQIVRTLPDPDILPLENPTSDPVMAQDSSSSTSVPVLFVVKRGFCVNIPHASHNTTTCYGRQNIADVLLPNTPDWLKCALYYCCTTINTTLYTSFRGVTTVDSQ